MKQYEFKVGYRGKDEKNKYVYDSLSFRDAVKKFILDMHTDIDIEITDDCQVDPDSFHIIHVKCNGTEIR